MVGTSGALRCSSGGPAPAPPEQLWCYRLDAERPVLGGSLSDGGSVVAWLRKVDAAAASPRRPSGSSRRWRPTATG